MTKKPTMAALKQQIDYERRPAVQPANMVAEPARAEEEGDRVIRGKRYPTYREGKVPVGGYFSPDLSYALHQLALDEGRRNGESSGKGPRRVKLQALLGEAIDLLLIDRGKHPFGER